MCKRALPFFTRLLLLYLGLGGSLFSFLTGFEIDCPYLPIALGAGVGGLLFLTALSLPRFRPLWYGILWAALLAGFWQHWHERWAPLGQGVRLVWEAVSTKYDAAYPGFGAYAAPEYTSLNADQSLVAVFLLLALILSGLLAWGLTRKRPLFPCLLFTLPLFCMPLVSMDVHAILPVGAQLAFWLLLILTRLARRGERKAEGLTLALAGPVCLLLLLPLLFSPPEKYERAQWSDDLARSLAQGAQDVCTALFPGANIDLSPLLGSAGVSWSYSTDRMDLSQAGAQKLTGAPILYVRSTASGPLYLRGLSLGAYTGSSWEALAQEDYEAFWVTEVQPTQDYFQSQSIAQAPEGELSLGTAQMTEDDAVDDSAPAVDPQLVQNFYRSAQLFTSQTATHAYDATHFSVEVFNSDDQSNLIYTPYYPNTVIMDGDSGSDFELLWDSAITSSEPFASYIADSIITGSGLYTGGSPVLPDSYLDGDYDTTYLWSRSYYDWDLAFYNTFAQEYYTAIDPELKEALLALADEWDIPYNTIESVLAEYKMPEWVGDDLYLQEYYISDYLGIPILSREELVQAVADAVSAAARYDLSTPATPAGEDYVLYFLQESQRGYCMHFASACAMMLRAMDIPARYVSGFLVNIDSDQTGQWVEVSDKQAHAWVEFYLDNVGWIPVDPTPRSELLAALNPASSTEPAEEEDSQAQDDPLEEDVQQEPDSQDQEAEDEPETPSAPEEEEASPAWTGPLWVGVLVLAVILFFPLRRRFRNRRRAADFAQPDRNRRAIALWLYGEALRRRYGGQVPEKAEELALKAKFSQHTLTEEECALMEEYVRTLARETDASLTPLRRFALRYLYALY